ncbi:succinate dehydrogenase subunit 4 mitochondrion [Cinnamomum micranthum f. kanehirae]|uniref:Succinate dehydrogenase subunit 4 mitochondrion n=1 Tax=Cinnamomum micranthum f. kanehirae TaxID=337451 RepID=A0A443Q4P7_9MAGN|nr:succinate dehydrogenase subunit 4 mitochondrion [Cinnamomum micranthum f. kanehirae]
MKERISGLRNESSKTKRTGLFQRMTAAFPPPLISISKKVYTSLPNLSLFWHINVGIEEIMADHVHQEMIRNWILIVPFNRNQRSFLVNRLSFPNKSKNLMDRTNIALAATKHIGLALRKERSVLIRRLRLRASNLVLPFPSRHGPARQEESLIHGRRSRHRSIRSEQQATASKPSSENYSALLQRRKLQCAGAHSGFRASEENSSAR